MATHGMDATIRKLAGFVVARYPEKGTEAYAGGDRRHYRFLKRLWTGEARRAEVGE